ncbi:MAG: transposase [Thermodesulfobacteriota bacterium]|jgi:putative transposase
MPSYIRAYVPGGTFFFTLVTYRRGPLLAQAAARQALRQAIRQVRSGRPFTIDAVAVMPDHLHMLWTLPPGDADFFDPLAPDQTSDHSGARSVGS